MREKNIRIRVQAVAACLLILIPAPVFSAAGTPLGTLTTRGDVRIGSTVAPSGSTVFSGDRISAVDSAAMVRFGTGGRLEMIHAVAALAGDSAPLVIRPERGLLRFSFASGEKVEFSAGAWRLVSSGPGAHTGQFAVNQNGQLAMVLTAGSFVAVRGGDTAQTRVTPAAPLVVLDQDGRGEVAKAGSRVVDPAKSWDAGSLSGKCVTAGGESHRIIDNSRNALTIQGVWKLASGRYEYTIADCGGMSAAQGGAHRVTMPGGATKILAVAGAAAAAALLVIAGVSSGDGVSPPPTSPVKSPS